MTVRVRYHREDASWWAESADLAGWTAAASTLSELRSLVREAVEMFAPGETALIEEGLPA